MKSKIRVLLKLLEVSDFILETREPNKKNYGESKHLGKFYDRLVGAGLLPCRHIAQEEPTDQIRRAKKKNTSNAYPVF